LQVRGVRVLPQIVCVAQDRTLGNLGVRSDVSYVKGRHNVRTENPLIFELCQEIGIKTFNLAPTWTHLFGSTTL